jgi:hypothetical protein
VIHSVVSVSIERVTILQARHTFGRYDESKRVRKGLSEKPPRAPGTPGEPGGFPKMILGFLVFLVFLAILVVNARLLLLVLSFPLHRLPGHHYADLTSCFRD